MIELKPHVAMNIATRKEVTYPEQIVYYNCRNVAKIGNKPGSLLAWFCRIDNEEIKQEIEEYVSAAVGWDAANSHMPPDTSQLEEQDDDLDD